MKETHALQPFCGFLRERHKMNILTIDIEEWYLEEVVHGSRPEFMALYDSTLERLLQTLSDSGIHGTFFCVGQMGRRFPRIVRKIAEAGHEIGCHSDVHTWLDKMTPAECREDTRKAVDELEQCLGRKVISYRAPAFSITDRNPWAFEVLAENGIECDASVFPAARDFGGFSGFGSDHPCLVSFNGIEIKEFPVCPAKMLGSDFVYSGGGYFRFFPEFYIRRKLSSSDYAMMYFHISDLAAVKNKFMSRAEYEDYYKESGSFPKRFKRYLKDNLACGDTFDKFASVVESYPFACVQEASDNLDWNRVPKVQLG